jgi:hypothetical protein
LAQVFKPEMTTDIDTRTSGLDIQRVGVARDYAAGTIWSQRCHGAGSIKRGWHQIVSCNDAALGGAHSIFVFGGFDPNGRCLNDILRSNDDGLSWTTVNPDAAWPGRAVFGSAMSSDGSAFYVMGGSCAEYGGFCNDVWRSSDRGRTWQCMTTSAQWRPRSGFSVAINPNNANELVVLGGSANNFTCLNDVWKSVDGGKNWTEVNACSPWEPRVDMAVVVTTSGGANKSSIKILVIGGDDWENNFYNDVWESSDFGETWELLIKHAPWESRAGHAVVCLSNNELLLMGGNVTCLKANKTFKERDIKRLNDVWSSVDGGSTWQISTKNAAWNPRTLLKAVASSDGRGVVVVGGWQASASENQAGIVVLSDVWHSEVRFEEISKQYSFLLDFGYELESRRIPSELFELNVIPLLLPFCSRN